MCGIFGHIHSDAELSLGDYTAQINALAHRGPDDFGVYCNQKCALGHRRLSIIDLSTGHQPIANEDKSMWIVCNGEIYNYKELAENLKKQGHVFSTRSDSEVILHLYEQFGEKCLEYLNGIFAFAIWDQNEEKLFLARDHIGVKPLFYYQSGNALAFASEIKAVMQIPSVKKVLSAKAVYQFFSHNYLPAPLTMFENIHSLPAGHCLTFRAGQVKVSKYWDVAFEPHPVANEDRLSEELRHMIEQSVTMQMVSDVPVGAFLSGGFDSSAVVKFMSRHSSAKIKTFNVRFKESSYDESEYARMAAQYFDTDHYEVFCGPEDYLKNIFDIVWHADNLTADISMLPLYLVSKLAHQEVKVVLSGDGADELFAGYPTYKADQLLGYYQRLPGVIINSLLPSVINRLPVSEKKMSWEFKAKRFVNNALMDPQGAHLSWRCIFDDQEKQRLLSKDILAEEFQHQHWGYRRYYQQTSGWKNLSRHQYADIKGWLVDSILAKVDFMSMAHGLEVRVPFLNPRLVEFAARIPADYQLRNFKAKYIVKKALNHDIPPKILNRSKAGFQIPFGRWLRSELKEFMTDVLCEERIRDIGCLNWAYIKELMDEHLALKRDHGYKLLSVLHFCLWYDKFIKSQSAFPDSFRTGRDFQRIQSI